MLFPVFRRYFVLYLLLFFMLVQNVARSESRLTPSLGLEETFLSSETETLDESGQITTISPGFYYEATGSRVNISLNYLLNARYYNNLSQDDGVDHSLLFRSDFAHIPNRWNSYLTSTIKQANVNPDAIQIVNPVVQSDNTRELRTLGIGTAIQGELTDKIDYESQLDADYADFEASESTDSVGILLGLNNSKSQQNSNWRASISSRVFGVADEDQQIDTAEAELNYRINHRYSVFFTINKNETGNEILDETNTIIGMLWTPNRNDSFKVGAGKRGDDTTYLLDVLIKSERISYTLNYDESVTTSRDLLVDETNQQGFYPTSQNLSITPVLIKNGRVAISLAGRRTDITLAYFKQTTNQTSTNSDDEITDGLSININRTLSESSSIQLNLSRQERQTTQENTIDDGSLSYDKALSKNASFSIELRKTEQTSDILENEYDQNSLTFRINSSF